MKNLSTIFTSLAFVTVVLTPLSAQAGHHGNHKKQHMAQLQTKEAKHHHGHGQNHKLKMKRMAHVNPMPNYMRIVVRHGETLDLSPDQEIALSKWRRKNHPKSMKLVDDILAGEKALMQASMDGSPKADLMKKFDEIAALRRQMVDMKSSCRDHMRKILSKEQLAKVAALYKAKYCQANNEASKPSSNIVTVSDAWARKSFISGGNSAAFMSIKNNGKDNVFVSAKSDVAKIVELHNHMMVDGVMRMRKVANGIPMKAGQVTELKQGGYHVMLIELTRDLKEGDTFPIELVFKHGKSIIVQAHVMAKKGGHRGSHH